MKKAKQLKGYFDVSANHFASVDLSPVVCPGAKMSVSCGYTSMSCQQTRGVRVHLHVEVVCPPYPAVAHGSVWFKGKKLNHTALAGSRHYMEMQAGRTLMRMPLAAEGDVKTCDKVEIKCDAHYELGARENAYRDPYCLENGEYEEGQECVPIYCDAYQPPANGDVWPSGKVMAGDRVVITCADGYKAFYTKGSRKNPKCQDSRTYQPGITCVPIMCAPFQAPAHGSVVPSGKVQAGNRVTITCDCGYRAMELRDRPPAQWPRFNRWRPGLMPSDLAGSATPLCLNSATYEEGITCVPVPVQCAAYPAPAHGSVWGPGGEYKVASPAGLEGWPTQQSLFITCDSGYRLSEHGRQTVRCLRSGQWETGKTCVPIMCQVT